MAVDIRPDLLPAAVALAKGFASLQALLGAPPNTRVSTKLPEAPVFPFLRATALPEAQDDYTPLRTGIVQWDAYAARGATRDTPDFPAASLVIRTLEAELFELAGARVETAAGAVWIYTAEIALGPQKIEEPDSTWGRFRLDTLLTMRSE